MILLLFISESELSDESQLLYTAEVLREITKVLQINNHVINLHELEKTRGILILSELLYFLCA
jgi:hypothetical protein